MYFEEYLTQILGHRTARPAPPLAVVWASVMAVSGFFSISVSARAAARHATSPSRADVGDAYALCAEGDTLAIPAGTAEWTSTLVCKKAITIQGAGIGQTIIKDNISGATNNQTEAVFAFETISGKAYRLTGVELQGGSRSAYYYSGAVQLFGNSMGIRIDHCKWVDVKNKCINIWDTACGVADHCEETTTGASIFLTVWHNAWNGRSFGDGSWEIPVNWGGPGAWYVEDCTLNVPNGLAVTDGFAGGHIVFRHNTVRGGHCDLHGTESTQRYRGTRSIECYENTFNGGGTAQVANMRSGSGVFFNNTATGYSTFCTLTNHRSTEAAYIPWGGANGVNVWDSNDPTLYGSGTHTGPASSPKLVVAGANWSPNQWQGYNVINLTSGKFGLVDSNTADTITFHVFTYAAETCYWSPGDVYNIRKVIHALDMPGMGKSDLLANWTPTPTGWPHQEPEPVYEWNNTLDGGNGQITTGYHVMREGVHFKNDTPKPGYTPYTYPHPLVMGTNPIVPPRNLRIQAAR